MTAFISQEKIDRTDIHHNQEVYPDFPVRQPKPSSSLLGHNCEPHSYLAIAIWLPVWRRNGRVEVCGWFHLNNEWGPARRRPRPRGKKGGVGGGKNFGGGGGGLGGGGGVDAAQNQALYLLKQTLLTRYF